MMLKKEVFFMDDIRDGHNEIGPHHERAQDLLFGVDIGWKLSVHPVSSISMASTRKVEGSSRDKKKQAQSRERTAEEGETRRH
jgi:hypothetical protein